MKKLVLFLFSISVFAQNSGDDVDALSLCESLQGNAFSSNQDADNALNKILSVVGLSKNFVLTPCSGTDNALAVTFYGIRHIFYDPNFLSLLSKNTSDWTNFFILAHEVGHHLNGHTLDATLYFNNDLEPPALEKRRRQELEADEFAAFVLSKLGSSLEDTIGSVSMVSDRDDTYSTHPRKSKRISAIRKGYSRANRTSPTIKKNIKLRNNSRVSNNALFEYETHKIYFGDSVVNKFNENGFLIKQEVYKHCRKNGLETEEEYKYRCKKKWYKKSQYEFFDRDWIRGLDLSRIDNPYYEILIKRILFHNNEYLKEEVTLISKASDLYTLKDHGEVPYIADYEGEFYEYYPNESVKTYAFFENNETKKYIRYWGSKKMKIIENVYSNRYYDGKLDKWFHSNGELMMEFAPITDFYFEDDYGTVYYENGQVFCEFEVIPEYIFDNLQSKAFNSSNELGRNNSLKNYLTPKSSISRFHTNKMYHPNGKVFAIINFDSQKGSVFSSCYDEYGNVVNCDNYSKSVKDQLRNIHQYSEVLKL